MAKETKATDFEKEQRIDLVCEFLIKGLSRSQMFKYVQNKTKWGISLNMLDRYVAEAKEKIKNSDNDKGFEIQRAKRRLEKLYIKNEDIEDFKECRAIIDTSAKLFGWNEAEKHDVNVKADFDITKLYKSEDQPEVE